MGLKCMASVGPKPAIKRFRASFEAFFEFISCAAFKGVSRGIGFAVTSMGGAFFVFWEGQLAFYGSFGLMFVMVMFHKVVSGKAG